MGFFDKIINKDTPKNNITMFFKWLDRILEQKLPEGIVAFNFNLYEGKQGTYDIQLIGSEDFEEDDEDWRCTDFFTSGEDVCCINRTQAINAWEDALRYITELVGQYLNKGNKAHILKSAQAVGIGFVDGDVLIINRYKYSL